MDKIKLKIKKTECSTAYNLEAKLATKIVYNINEKILNKNYIKCVKKDLALRFSNYLYNDIIDELSNIMDEFRENRNNRSELSDPYFIYDRIAHLTEVLKDMCEYE